MQPVCGLFHLDRSEFLPINSPKPSRLILSGSEQSWKFNKKFSMQQESLFLQFRQHLDHLEIKFKRGIPATAKEARQHFRRCHLRPEVGNQILKNRSAAQSA